MLQIFCFVLAVAPTSLVMFVAPEPIQYVNLSVSFSCETQPPEAKSVFIYGIQTLHDTTQTLYDTIQTLYEIIQILYDVTN